ncbi:MAG: RDD family protein [Phycisphaerae bacterium]
MWSYSVNGQQYGPVDEPTLQRMFQQGQLGGDAYVWREGMPDWLPAGQVAQFAGYLPQQGQPGGYEQSGGQTGYPQGGYGQAQTLGYQSYAGMPRFGGFWLRFVAYILDVIVLGVGGLIYSIPLGTLAEEGEGTAAGAGYIALSNVISIVVGWLYFALMESSTRQATLGKMALGLKVTGYNLERIGFGQATGRYFGKILSGIILFIGFIMVAFTEKKQGLHDKMASTYVIKG